MELFKKWWVKLIGPSEIVIETGSDPIAQIMAEIEELFRKPLALVEFDQRKSNNPFGLSKAKAIQAMPVREIRSKPSRRRRSATKETVTLMQGKRRRKIVNPSGFCDGCFQQDDWFAQNSLPCHICPGRVLAQEYAPKQQARF